MLRDESEFFFKFSFVIAKKIRKKRISSRKITHMRLSNITFLKSHYQEICICVLKAYMILFVLKVENRCVYINKYIHINKKIDFIFALQKGGETNKTKKEFLWTETTAEEFIVIAEKHRKDNLGGRHFSILIIWKKWIHMYTIIRNRCFVVYVAILLSGMGLLYVSNVNEKNIKNIYIYTHRYKIS